MRCAVTTKDGYTYIARRLSDGTELVGTEGFMPSDVRNYSEESLKVIDSLNWKPANLINGKWVSWDLEDHS